MLEVFFTALGRSATTTGKPPERAAGLLRAASGFLLLVALLNGCAGRTPKPQATEETPAQTLWPAPPDEPRFKYEWRLHAISDIQPVADENALRDRLTGIKSGEQTAFIRPAGIAASRGRIYVTDSQGASVVVFDVPRRRVFKFGQRHPNTLGKPIDIAIDAGERIYVLDAKHKKVLVFDPLGLYQKQIGKPETLVRPAGIAVNQAGDRIYIADRGSPDGDDHRVHVYDDKGRKLFEIGPRGPADGQLNIPLDVAVDERGDLLVVDSGNFRIQRFTADGRFVSSFGSVGNSLGQFSRPRAIAVGADGNIYVSDGVFNNVQIFDAQGQLLMHLGNYGIDRDRPGQFGLIAGVAVDETNRVYVVDQYFNKAEVYRRIMTN